MNKPRRNPSVLDDALQQGHFTKKHSLRRTLEREREATAKWLCGGGTYHEEAQLLAEKLISCKPAARCGSGACPECAHAYSRLFAEAARRLVSAENAYCVTLVVSGERYRRNHLVDVETRNLTRRIRERIELRHGEAFLGGIDLTMNEESTGWRRGFWQFHAHGVVITRDLEGLRVSMRRRFPDSQTVPRPVRFTPWDGDSTWLRYCFKSPLGRARRISIDSTRHDSQTGKKRACRATDKQPLRAADRLELLLYLDSVRPGQRLVLRNAQFRNSHDGPRFAVIASPDRRLENK